MDTCPSGRRSRKLARVVRISGPILDRIDIHLEVQRVPMDKLAALDGCG